MPSWVIWYMVHRALVPATVVVIVSAGLGFLTSGYFAVRQVTVRAEDLSIAQEAAAGLHVPAGTNTVFCRLSDIADQAARCPRVLDARVDRDLPDMLIVRLTSREPLFALRAGSGHVLVDEEGILLIRSKHLGPGFPVVRGLVEGQHTIGGRLSPDCLEAVLACIEGAHQGGLGLGFTLDLATRYDYRLTTPAGTIVKLGGPDNLVRKVIVASSVERHLGEDGRQVEYIDVRLPAGAPSYRLKAKAS